MSKKELAMRCSNCGKEITEKPCQYCGSEDANITLNLHDTIILSDVANLELITYPAEVTIEKKDETRTFTFPAGSSSKEIVNASLEKANLSGVTPTYIREQIVYNINKLERYVSEHQKEEIEDEHSFSINLGIFKYNFKRKIKKT